VKSQTRATSKEAAIKSPKYSVKSPTTSSSRGSARLWFAQANDY